MLLSVPGKLIFVAEPPVSRKSIPLLSFFLDLNHSSTGPHTMRLLLSAEVVADTTATAASSRIDSIKTIFNPATCLSRGFCHVAKTGSTSHELYYELHGDRTASTEKGTTTTKVLLIMGLNNSCFVRLSPSKLYSFRSC